MNEFDLFNIIKKARDNVEKEERVEERIKMISYDGTPISSSMFYKIRLALLDALKAWEEDISQLDKLDYICKNILREEGTRLLTLTGKMSQESMTIRRIYETVLIDIYDLQDIELIEENLDDIENWKLSISNILRDTILDLQYEKYQLRTHCLDSDVSMINLAKSTSILLDWLKERVYISYDLDEDYTNLSYESFIILYESRQLRKDIEKSFEPYYRYVKGKEKNNG